MCSIFESFENVFCPLDLCCVNVSVQLKEYQKSKAEAMILVLSDMELWVPVETHPYNCGLGVGTTESHPGENATASLFFLTWLVSGHTLRNACLRTCALVGHVLRRTPKICSYLQVFTANLFAGASAVVFLTMVTRQLKRGLCVVGKKTHSIAVQEKVCTFRSVPFLSAFSRGLRGYWG